MKGIHVVGLQAENFRRLTVADVRLIPERGLVRVTGENKSGKTSTLKAFAAAFGGASEIAEMSVNDMSDDGTGAVRVPLSNGFAVERRFTEAAPKGYLTVVGPDGGKHGQAKLDGWLGKHHDFDVLAFFGLRPERQREILMGLSSDPDLATKLDAFRAQYAALDEERRPLNSTIQRIQRMQAPDGEAPEPVDVSASMAELAVLQRAERVRGAARQAMDVAKETQCRRAEEYDRQQAEVARLEKLLAEAHAAASQAVAVLAKAAAAVGDAAEHYNALTDPSEAIDAITARISEADAINARLAPFREWEKAQAEIAEAKAAADRLTEQMQALREQERMAIARAGIPVEGLAFEVETGRPFLNGRPFELASGAERIRAAVQVAFAADPELRVCLIDEGNDLGLPALEELDRLATAHDFQVFACRLGIEGAGELVVVDGEAWSNGDVRPSARESVTP